MEFAERALPADSREVLAVSSGKAEVNAHVFGPTRGSEWPPCEMSGGCRAALRGRATASQLVTLRLESGLASYFQVREL